MFGRSQKDKNRLLAEALDPDSGDINAAAAAIERGADVNGLFGDSKGRLPMHLAAVMRPAEKAEQAIDLLLKHGAKIAEADSDRYRPLDYAIASKDLRIVKKLIAAGANVMTGSYRATALLSAFDAQFWEGAEYLLALNPGTALIPGAGSLPLTLAIEGGAPRNLLEKLISAKADVNAAAGGNRTALHAAAEQKNADYLEFVLGCPGVDVNIVNHDGRTLLHASVLRGDLRLAARMIRAGADPDLASGNGDLPVIDAVSGRREDLLALLLEAGASPGARDGQDRTSLSVAVGECYYTVRQFSVAMIGRLLDTLKPATLNQATLNQNAPAGDAGPGANKAAERVNKAAEPVDKAAEPLQTRKQDLERPYQPLTADDLKQALFEAIYRNKPEIVELLVKAGADVSAENAEGQTPLMSAAARGGADIVTILLKAGADLEKTGLSGKTAFDIASDHRNEEAKSALAIARRNLPKAPVAPKVIKEDGPYRRLSDTLLEISEPGLTTIFNFRTQQIITRGNDNAAPPAVQNFDDLQRQEAIEEAYNKLKELGGNPPAYDTIALEKKAHVLKRG